MPCHSLNYLWSKKIPVQYTEEEEEEEEEDLRIIQTEQNHRPSASNWKLSHINISERAGLEPTTLAVKGK